MGPVGEKGFFYHPKKTKSALLKGTILSWRLKNEIVVRDLFTKHHAPIALKRIFS